MSASTSVDQRPSPLVIGFKPVLAVAVLAILGVTGILLHLIVRRTQRKLIHWMDRGQH
mgnify:CR=1 FL=1